MEKYTVAEIEKKLRLNGHPDLALISELEKDERKGVQQLLKRWKKSQVHNEMLKEKFFSMMEYETKLHNQGFRQIAGIDEVGRGPLAGPVVAAAVILPEGFYLPGIDDSKKLTETKRDEYCKQIKLAATAIAIAAIDPIEIDSINIYEATKKAMLAAVAGLETAPDCLLTDAVKLDTPYHCEAIIKGDAKSISIAAASIVAKVYRDNYMKQVGLLHPEYGFEKNMGYGTKEHLKAIQQHGITRYHRKSFAPVKQMLFS